MKRGIYTGIKWTARIALAFMALAVVFMVVSIQYCQLAKDDLLFK